MLYQFLKDRGIFETLKTGKLIDIGSGDGSQGKEFENEGWIVFNVEKKDGLDATTFNFPENSYDLAIARNSLPFMGIYQMEVVENIYKSLKKDGFFYGTVFGKDDPWAKEGLITAVNFDAFKEQILNLGFTILWVTEEKGIGKRKNGELKDWHILKFLVKK